MIKTLFFYYFKLDRSFYNDVNYSYFTDNDLIDDTNYISSLLFKSQSKHSN
mgnify:CR=1 FL=1